MNYYRIPNKSLREESVSMNEIRDALSRAFGGRFLISEDFCFDAFVVKTECEYNYDRIFGVKIQKMTSGELIDMLEVENSVKSTNIPEKNSIIVGMVKEIVEKYKD